MAQLVPKVNFTFTLVLIDLADLCITNNGWKEAAVMNENNTEI
jgi:PHD/YefM family antitoxin component YafN of YafNO toxin-antitoxin module